MADGYPVHARRSPASLSDGLHELLRRLATERGGTEDLPPIFSL